VRLLARLELGDEIPEALYRTIAEIIAFAWYLKGKCPPGFQAASHEQSAPSLPLLNGPGH
jgi:flagellar biosynthesis protein